MTLTPCSRRSQRKTIWRKIESVNQTLNQHEIPRLSREPRPERVRAGLTPCLTMWSWTGSNRRPHDCQSCALPTELQPRARTDLRKARGPRQRSKDAQAGPRAGEFPCNPVVPAYSFAIPAVPEWWNWQTRWTQNPVRVDLVWVRVPPPAPHHRSASPSSGISPG